MPLDRSALERVVALVNAHRRPDQAVQVASHTPKGFTLVFTDRPMPEGQCLDEDFVDIQFRLNAEAKVDTGIVGARFDEEQGRYVVEYEVVEWD